MECGIGLELQAEPILTIPHIFVTKTEVDDYNKQ